MVYAKKILNSKLAIFILLLGLNIPILLPLTHQGYFPTQDHIYVARVYEMKVGLEDGYFPVRWVKDFRYGEPLFNFYAPLPYYAGALIKTTSDFIKVPLSYLDITKMLFGLGFILSTFTMYLFISRLLNIHSGILAAALYLYAPYHSVDVYVRGALSESWALIFFPLIFYFSFKLSKETSLKNILLLSLSFAGLFYTHNIMTMLFVPFVLLWMMFWVIQKRQLKLGIVYLISVIWAVGMGASFLLPALFEKQLVQSDKLITGYFDFRGHFVELPQFFKTFWGYGPSVYGGNDGMSFQVGLIHWGLLVLSSLSFLALFLKRQIKKNVKQLFFYFLFFIFCFLFSLFMQHNKSAFVWEKISLLSYTQFPWRFLGISIFFVSLSGVFMLSFLQKKMTIVLTVGIVILTIVVNVGYFHPEQYYTNAKDSDYISAKVLTMENILPKDYLPIWVKKIEDGKFYNPKLIQGNASITNYNEKTALASFDINAQTESKVLLPLTFFPGWQASINGRKTSIQPVDDSGLISIQIPQGDSQVSLKFQDTPVRTASNILSIFSLTLTVLLLGLTNVRKYKYFHI